eukprot:CAMPEP_0168427286 /NCGR_PEP_ID=MMETSP0228-20121227/36270_1 /TAXON_ID=133427 /ORGANISM="Protoceratium reticulatum, Strain CCCM 535 (=CCMP 1889)" /LENGTH=36 /DNA_ID= /DNA_START= /DNA_END= /DNA_ORIENTATION=
MTAMPFSTLAAYLVDFTVDTNARAGKAVAGVDRALA